MTTFQRESFADVIDEIKPLLEKHWQEIAHFKDIPLAPNWAGYEAAEKAGSLRIYTARKDELIGYGVFFIGNMHYATTKIATQDILFLLPEHRQGGVGYRLIRFCDEQLNAEGAQAVYHHVKHEVCDFGPLLKRMGYVAVDTIYGRRF
jgi:GNAT superfamily N-acetyltransferase